MVAEYADICLEPDVPFARGEADLQMGKFYAKMFA